MDNLEQITEAYKMNYGAVIHVNFTAQEFSIKGCVVKIINEDNIILQGGEVVEKKEIEEHGEIIGYKYLGELGGNEEIKEGQRFSPKSSPSQIYTYKGKIGKDRVDLFVDGLESPSYMFDKSEIEPVF